jgi:hypothetical protein
VEYEDCVPEITKNMMMKVDAKTAARTNAARMFLEKFMNSHWLSARFIFWCISVFNS